MKTNIYTLLGMIKDGKAPKKIIYEGRVFEYDEDSVVMRDYYNKEFGHLFDDIDCITEVLNDEVEILETTITYKPDKIEKLGFINNTSDASDLVALRNMQWENNQKFYRKINEIIDRVNNEG